MQVMVFDSQLGITQLQQPRDRRRRERMDADTTVTHDFREGDILETEPPLVKPKWEADEPQRAKRQKGHEDHLDKLLFIVAKGRVQRAGVFGQVVRAVVFPEIGHFVAGSVVGVEEKVEDDAVETQLGEKAWP